MNTGGDDFIVTGDDSDYVMGGTAEDVVGTGSDASGDFVIGDHGQMNFNASGDLVRMESIDPTEGANDAVYAQEGPDVVIGGFGDDTIVAGADDVRDTAGDLAIGDNGLVTFRDDGSRLHMRTTDPEIGGNDAITTGGGNDVVFGGQANDNIDSGSQDDFVFGDHAEVDFDANSDVTKHAIVTDPTLGRNRRSSPVALT